MKTTVTAIIMVVFADVNYGKIANADELVHDHETKLINFSEILV